MEIISCTLIVGLLSGFAVDDELLKITRIGNSMTESERRSPVPRTIRGRPPPLSADYSQQVISGVRFSPLVGSPAMPTVIRSRVWVPSLHRYYPESFRKSCKEILLCAHAPTYQPSPPVASQQINVASQLHRSIWMEILSYTHRDWFAQPHCEETVLRRRLEQELQATQRAREAQMDAEARLHMVERERDAYRRLAMRCQARLRALMHERGEAVSEAEDLLVDVDDDDDDISQAASAAVLDPIFLRLSGMNAVIHQFQEDSSDDDEDPPDDDEDAMGQADMESDDDRSTAMEDSAEDMESDFGMAVSSRSPAAASAMQIRQARTVSISSQGL